MQLIDFILHIDHHLVNVVNSLGIYSYVILFLIIFIETGLVVFPFLPGDSLIFAAAAMCANPKYSLNIFICYLIFIVAAVLGDSLNYEIGRWSSEKSEKSQFLNRFINKDKRLAAEHFFEKHGGKTILLARFIPFIRTFVPFVSGASKMSYPHFIFYNVIGGVLWISLFSILGYFFGNIPQVQDHFSLIVIAIVLISILPIVFIYFKNKTKKA
ncbi:MULTISPECIES: VTT domain-containing protein [Holzapfeliella]|uniref:DedA family membrane protein n=1 Tax=Holzapfeliella floricola DSM 23037 = JCM 16512 TaxID=1423744 RepID=A0A0R2DKA1_9LACO|nr:VTT domain-containing protein [Holzapfeliella floricola]KRN04543.1 DedA family membrane protein [Holzapfeliella floricola DSM 23037 = JCM 16512]